MQVMIRCPLCCFSYLGTDGMIFKAQKRGKSTNHGGTIICGFPPFFDTRVRDLGNIGTYGGAKLKIALYLYV